MALLHSCYYLAWSKSVHQGEERLWKAQKKGQIEEVNRCSPGPDTTGGKSCARKVQTEVAKQASLKGEQDLERKERSLNIGSSGRLCNYSSSRSPAILHAVQEFKEGSFYSIIQVTNKILNTTRPRAEPLDTVCDSPTTVRFPTNYIPKVLDHLLFKVCQTSVEQIFY